jgi:hypothetical protein
MLAAWEQQGTAVLRFAREQIMRIEM